MKIRFVVMLVVLVGLGILASGQLRAQDVQPAAADEKSTRALEVVTKMREALGGDAKLAAVSSLSLSGDFRRVISRPGQDPLEMSGDLEVDLLLPDCLLRTETTSFGGPGTPSATRLVGLDGGSGWVSMQGAPFMRRPQESAPGAAGGPGSGGGRPDPTANLRAEMARWILVLLGRPSVLEPLRFSYAGEAEAPEGRALVLDVSHADGFSAQLFVDAATYRPLMLSYKEPGFRMGRRDGAPRREEGRPPTPEELAEREARRQQPPPLVDSQLFFSGYKAVDGVLLPHEIRKSQGGTPTEELTVKKLKVNPALKRDKFKRQS